jgi:hypothetical protein
MSPKRSKSSSDAKFARGETGVDGAATEETADAEAVEQAKAQEALLRGRTWLGREAFTWLLWKSESTEPILTLDRKPVSVVFNDKLSLRAGGGEVVELAVKGVASPYSELVRRAIRAQLMPHVVRIQLTHGDQTYDASLDAECFDIKSAKLPALLQEEESERLTERLEFAGRLSALVDAIIEHFMELRTSRTWDSRCVPAIKEWLASRKP